MAAVERVGMTLAGDALLDGGAVLPGFRVLLSALFV